MYLKNAYQPQYEDFHAIMHISLPMHSSLTFTAHCPIIFQDMEILHIECEQVKPLLSTIHRLFKMIIKQKNSSYLTFSVDSGFPFHKACQTAWLHLTKLQRNMSQDVPLS